MNKFAQVSANLFRQPPSLPNCEVGVTAPFPGHWMTWVGTMQAWLENNVLDFRSLRKSSGGELDYEAVDSALGPIRGNPPSARNLGAAGRSWPGLF